MSEPNAKRCHWKSRFRLCLTQISHWKMMIMPIYPIQESMSIPSLTSSEIRNWSRSVFPFLALGRMTVMSWKKTDLGSRSRHIPPAVSVEKMWRKFVSCVKDYSSCKSSQILSDPFEVTKPALLNQHSQLGQSVQAVPNGQKPEFVLHHLVSPMNSMTS